MEDVDEPLIAYPVGGKHKPTIMQPGGNYRFPGAKYVIEVPMRKYKKAGMFPGPLLENEYEDNLFYQTLLDINGQANPAAISKNSTTTPPELNFSFEQFRPNYQQRLLSQQQTQFTPTQDQVEQYFRDNPDILKDYLDSKQKPQNFFEEALFNMGQEKDVSSRLTDFGYASGKIPEYYSEKQKGLAKTGKNLAKVGSAVTAVISGVKDYFTGFAAARRDSEAQKEWWEKLAENRERSNTMSMKRGGTIPMFQDGGQAMDNRIIAGFSTTGIPENSPQIPNAEVEEGEVLMDPQGNSVVVEGKKHSQGGEEMELEPGTIIISDHLKPTQEFKTFIEDSFEFKTGKNDTYAKLVERYDKKIGYDKLEKEYSTLIGKLKDNEEVQHETTRQINEEFLAAKVQELEQEKSEFDQVRNGFIQLVFAEQERQKQIEERTTQFQDGGQTQDQNYIVQSYAQVTGTPVEEIEQALTNMSPAERQEAISQMQTEMEQMGVDQEMTQQDIEEIIQTFAELSGTPIEEVMQQLQNLSEPEFNQAIQEMVVFIQQTSSQQPMMQDGGAIEFNQAVIESLLNSVPTTDYRDSYQQSYFQDGGIPTEEVDEQAAQEELMQLIQMFSELTGTPVEEILQQLQQLSEEELQQAIQEMVEFVQQAIAEQGQDVPEDQQQPMMQDGGGIEGITEEDIASFAEALGVDIEDFLTQLGGLSEEEQQEILSQIVQFKQEQQTIQQDQQDNEVLTIGQKGGRVLPKYQNGPRLLTDDEKKAMRLGYKPTMSWDNVKKIDINPSFYTPELPVVQTPKKQPVSNQTPPTMSWDTYKNADILSAPYTNTNNQTPTNYIGTNNQQQTTQPQVATTQPQGGTNQTQQSSGNQTTTSPQTQTNRNTTNQTQTSRNTTTQTSTPPTTGGRGRKPYTQEEIDFLNKFGKTNTQAVYDEQLQHSNGVWHGGDLIDMNLAIKESQINLPTLFEKDNHGFVMDTNNKEWNTNYQNKYVSYVDEGTRMFVEKGWMTEEEAAEFKRLASFTTNTDNTARGVDGKWGVYTSTRPALRRDLVTPEQLRLLNEAGIVTAVDAMNNEQKAREILGDLYDTVAFDREVYGQYADYVIGSIQDSSETTPGEETANNEPNKEENKFDPYTAPNSNKGSIAGYVAGRPPYPKITGMPMLNSLFPISIDVTNQSDVPAQQTLAGIAKSNARLANQNPNYVNPAVLANTLGMTQEQFNKSRAQTQMTNVQQNLQKDMHNVGQVAAAARMNAEARINYNNDWLRTLSALESQKLGYFNYLEQMKANAYANRYNRNLLNNMFSNLEVGPDGNLRIKNSQVIPPKSPTGTAEENKKGKKTQTV